MAISFITTADLLIRYDWRWIGNNILDTIPSTAATEAQVLASPKVEALIQTASEMVMAAAAVGARYTPEEVQQYGGALLAQIVSDLVAGLILKRRMRASDDEKPFTAAYEEALAYLEQLRRGERIFYAVPDVPQAGLPTTTTMAAQPGFGPLLATNNVRVFGTIGQAINYGQNYGGNNGPGGFC